MGLKGQRETVVCQVMADALEGVEPTGAALCAYDDGQVVEEFTTRGVVATGYTRWAREGASATARPPEGPFDHITLRLPHGREAQLRDVHLLGSRLTPTGSLWVHGANDEGIKSIGKRLEPLFDEVLTASTRRHCRVIEAVGPRPELRGDRESWVVNCQAEVGEVEVTWASVPGLFAHGRLDMATRMLLESLPPLTGTVLDFGCGAGVIGRTLVLRGDAITMHQSDVDALALEMAQRNVPRGDGVVGRWTAVHRCPVRRDRHQPAAASGQGHRSRAPRSPHRAGTGSPRPRWIAVAGDPGSPGRARRSRAQLCSGRGGGPRPAVPAVAGANDPLSSATGIRSETACLGYRPP